MKGRLEKLSALICCPDALASRCSDCYRGCASAAETVNVSSAEPRPAGRVRFRRLALCLRLESCLLVRTTVMLLNRAINIRTKDLCRGSYVTAVQKSCRKEAPLHRQSLLGLKKERRLKLEPRKSVQINK